MYLDSTIIILIPAIIFSMIASAGVKNTFAKFFIYKKQSKHDRCRGCTENA